MKQYLCSHLITLRSASRDTMANLEKIWADGAIVNAEEAIPAGDPVSILTDGHQLTGTVTSCETDAAGNFIEITLATTWSLEMFIPDHLTDPDLLPQPSASGPQNFC